MTRIRFIVALVALVGGACGPTVQIDPSPGSSTGGGSSTTTQDTSTSVAPTIVPADSTSSGGTTTSDTTGSEGSTTEDPFTCGCPDDQPIDFDQPTREGFSAADVLATYALTDIPWDWTAFESSPTATTLHLSLVYEGGQVIDGPGGEDGCNFLSSPCTPALVIPVRADLVTDDGILMGSMPGTFTYSVDFGTGANFLAYDVPVELLGGTLAEQVIPDRMGGPPLVLALVAYEQRWDDGLPSTGWMTGSDGTTTAVLGSFF